MVEVVAQLADFAQAKEERLIPYWEMAMTDPA